jgi:hypothetical protein
LNMRCMAPLQYACPHVPEDQAVCE